MPYQRPSPVALTASFTWTECNVSYSCVAWDILHASCMFIHCHWKGPYIIMYSGQNVWLIKYYCLHVYTIVIISVPFQFQFRLVVYMCGTIFPSRVAPFIFISLIPRLSWVSSMHACTYMTLTSQESQFLCSQRWRWGEPANESIISLNIAQ